MAGPGGPLLPRCAHYQVTPSFFEHKGMRVPCQHYTFPLARRGTSFCCGQTHSTEFDEMHLHKDVSDAIPDVHVKGVMYKWIEKDTEQYIVHGDEICAVNHKKKLFLITFSLFPAYRWGCAHSSFWAHGKLSLMSLMDS